MLGVLFLQSITLYFSYVNATRTTKYNGRRWSCRSCDRQWFRYVQSRIRRRRCTTCCIPVNRRPTAPSGTFFINYRIISPNWAFHPAYLCSLLNLSFGEPCIEKVIVSIFVKTSGSQCMERMFGTHNNNHTLRLLGATEIHCNGAVYVSLNTNANPNPDPKWA